MQEQYFTHYMAEIHPVVVAHQKQQLEQVRMDSLSLCVCMCVYFPFLMVLVDRPDQILLHYWNNLFQHFGWCVHSVGNRANGFHGECWRFEFLIASAALNPEPTAVGEFIKIISGLSSCGCHSINDFASFILRKGSLMTLGFAFLLL